MAIRRIAIIFDDTARPETTGTYCQRALGQLAEVEHFRPTELARIPRDAFDLYLAVDDGLTYGLPADLRPLACWIIDTHLDFARSLQRARTADFVFAAQRNGAQRLRAEGIDSARWLPLACDPEVHGRREVERRYDVAFVGNVFPGERERLLKLVAEHYPNSFLGTLDYRRMAEIYSAARIVFNRSIGNDLNMRVFEGLASGSLLLTDALTENGLEELLQDGVHLATYRSDRELLQKLAYFLDPKHAEQREQIAARGREEVLARHTYRHRMQWLLQLVESQAGRANPGRIEQAPSKSVHAVTTPSKTRGYYEHARPDVAALVPESARRILDVGCGAGRLGESLKQRQGAEVVGIELQPEIAERARSRLDRVLVGNIEDLQFDFPKGRFDCVVCADVLEHLRAPDQLLKRIQRWLTPDGSVVASVPNVQHHSVVRSLLAGNWTPEAAGLLDQDHVRFFTRREIEKLFFRAGFEVTDYRGLVLPEEEQDVRGRVHAGRLRIDGLSPEAAREFYTYQYVLRAQPRPRSEWGLTSIVIVTRNALSYTRECVDSLGLRTDEPYELIFVDNGSSDGTCDYLRSLEGVKLIENAENRGFPAAVNQGLAIARGEQVLLLNNDCIVTTSWLHRMLRAMSGDPAIGLVGPCSNSVSGPQQVRTDYDLLQSLDGFAWGWGRRHKGQLIETDRLVGFCLLIRRELIERIGHLDERFGIGCFEDDDYCRRALAAGFRCVIARDAFVHHFGSRTFRDSGTDLVTVLRENQRKFEEKWELVRNEAQAFSPQPAAEGPDGAVENTGGAAEVDGLRLSLCMIVRDNERTLEACLESVRPWVDEIVVVDTGSTDRTLEIARQYGARVFHFPWCDDFAAARNESLRHARGEWIFWMDSDDTIDVENGHKLRNLANAVHPLDVLGYVAQVHCPGPAGEGEFDVTAVDHVKLIRNRPDLRFEGRIHEQILPSIRRAGGTIAFTDLFVVHSGSDHTPAGRARKLERDFRLLKLDLAERPDHPFVLFNLGMTHADAGQHEQAIAHLERCLTVSDPADSHVRKAYALLVSSCAQDRQHERAWEACRRGLELCPSDPELLFRAGMLHHHFRRLPEAVECYRSVLQQESERYFTSRDRGLSGFKARHNLALVYEELGELDLAEKEWRAVVAEVPAYRAGWRGLGHTLVRQGRLGEAQQLADSLARSDDSSLRVESLLLHAELARAQSDWEKVRSLLTTAVQQAPDDLAAVAELSRFFFDRGQLAEAQAALRTLCERDAADGAAAYNLGLVCLRLQQPEQAITAFRESLRRRPRWAATYLQLGHALQQSGQTAQAQAVWNEALRIAPTDGEIREALAHCEQAA